MAIADLFRPKHKHSKKDVRAQAVADTDDVAILVDVARHDREDSLRKQAIEKIDDPELLMEIAAAQEAAAVKAWAQERASTIWIRRACRADEVEPGLKAVTRAINALGERAVAEIATSADLPEIRERALAMLTDEKALAQVVRSARRAEERTLALEGISDEQILRAIAIDENRKEVATAAIDRIASVDILEEVAAKAKSKPIRNRAKRRRAQLLKDQQPSGEVSDGDKRERAERVQLARAVEGFAGGDEWIRSRKQVDEAKGRWQELGESRDHDLGERFQVALARYERNYEVYAAAALEAQRRREEEEKRAREVEERRLRERESRRDAPRQDQASTLPLGDVQQDGAVDDGGSSPDSSPTEGVDTTSEGATRRGNEEAEQRALETAEKICRGLEELVSSERLRGFEKALKSADRRFRAAGPLRGEAASALRDRFEAARRAAVIRLGELREADEWRQWAAVPKMEDLVRRARALVDAEAIEDGGAVLKELQSEWKSLGGGPKERTDELWGQFKEACDAAYDRVKAARDEMAAQQAENLLEKMALVERAEELKDSTDWEATSAELKDLQARWKAIGPVPRRKADAIWKRFREACDQFFEARSPHLEDRLNEESDNLAAKREVLAEMGGLADREGDPDDLIEELKALQGRWRTIGRVPRSELDALQSAYEAASQAVYARRDRAAEQALASERAAILSLRERIASCADAGWDSDETEIARQVVTIHGDVLALDESVEGYDDLLAALTTLLLSQLETNPSAYVGTSIDPERSMQAREELITRAEALAPDVGEATSPEEMAERLREALADRALGGVLSKNAGMQPSELVEDWRREWRRLPPVPGPEGRRLTERFDAVCERLLSTDS